MKKIFAFVAIACMAFGLASCSDESSAGGREVSNKEFKLVVSTVENNAVFSVYPTDEDQTYYWDMWTVKQFKQYDMNDLAQMAIENNWISSGTYENATWTLYGNTDYVFVAFYLDENGAISKKMTTLYFTTGHIKPIETVEFKYEGGDFWDYTQEPYVYEDEEGIHYEYYWVIDVYNNDTYDDLDLYICVYQDSPMSGSYEACDMYYGDMLYWDQEEEYWNWEDFVEAKIKVSRNGKKATAKGYVIDEKGIRYNVDVKADLVEYNDEAPARRLPARKNPARKSAPKLGIRAQMK